MRLGLTYKIFGGYLVLISLLGLIALYGGVTLHQLMGEYRRLVDTGIPLQRTLYSLEEVFRLQTGNEKKFYVVASPAIAELFNAQNEEWASLGEKLRKGSLSGRERDMVDHLLALHRAYMSGVAQNVALHDDPTLPGPRPAGEVDTQPLIEAISQRLGELAQVIGEDQERMVAEAQQRGEHITGVTLSLGLFTMLVGLAVAYGFAVLITRPVRRLKSATEEVAMGIYNRKVPVASRDEIGDLAEAFNHMARQLESLDEVREEFIAYISHELKTPLTSLKEANSLLLDGVAGELTERQRQLLGIVQEDCTKIERLITELLELSKMEAGMMPFDREEHAFSSIVDAAVEEMCPVAETRRVILQTTEGKSVRVLADASRMREVLTNLISNAIKFSPEESLVTVSWKTSAGEVIASVADQGPGIPEAARELIFEKFHQLTPSALSGMRGTGLGLPIARKIVEFHGGALWVECPPGGGSVFRFSLPRVAPESGHGTTPAPDQRATAV